MKKSIQKIRHLVVVFMFISLYSYGQGTVVRGTVKSFEDEALPGVNILVANTTSGTITDIDGNYTITVPNTDATLVFSYVGYNTEEIPLNGRTTLDVTLVGDIQSLSEVVVTGYGTQRKRDVTGAVSQVKGEEIRNIPVPGIDRALQGRAAGVAIAANGGAPGSGSTMRIRGTGSIYGNNDPLYVLDGVPLGESVGGIERIVNPADVESVEILKDASAAAIYGSRGANGVVLITTKKGASGAPQITLNAYGGTKTPWQRPELGDAAQFARINTLARINDGDDPIEQIENADLSRSTDWWDVVTQPGSVYNVDFNLRGGTERMRYSTSLGYFKEDGFIKTTEFDRLSIRLNAEYDLTKWLTIGNNLSIIHNGSRGITENTPEGGGVMASIYQMDPISTVYKTEEERLAAEAQGVDLTNPLNLYSQSRFTNRSNLAGRLARNNGRDTELRMMGNIFASIKIIDGLTFRTDLGLHSRKQDTYNFGPRYEIGPNDRADLSSVSRGYRTNFDYVFTNTLTYAQTLGKHDFSVMVGQTAEEFTMETLMASREGTLTNDPALHYLDAAEVITGNSGLGQQNNLLSYLARLNYSFNDKYLLTASFRADGSSRFAENNRWGYFPSLSVGWRISEEQFITNIAGSWLSDMKIRAGWGQIGNQRIPDNAYVTLLRIRAADRYAFGANEEMQTGVTPDNLGNPNIQWETVEQLNLAIDMGLFQNKVTLTAEYFIKDSKDALVRLPQPGYVGGPTPWSNAGQIRNSGVEITAGYRNRENRLKYGINGNVSFLKNEVLDLGGVEQISGGNTRAGGTATRTEVGHPIGSFFGHITDGIFQNEAEVDAHATQTNAGPGDFRFVDINEDGVINDEDRTFIGSPHPDVTFGVNFSAEYGNFDLNIFFQGQAGNDIYMEEKIYSWTGTGEYNSIQGLAEMAWSGEGTSNTQPIIRASDNNRNFRVSDWYLSDGSFVRLKNVQLGYNLPNSLVSRWGISGLRFWVGGENLLTFTKFEGLDPELGVIQNPPAGAGAPPSDRGNLTYGMNMYAYPVARTFMGGLTLNF